jgi:hypothetical protein
MRFNDLLNPKTGPEALVRLALYPLFFLVIGSLAITIMSQLKATDLLLALLFLIMLCPLAYVIREHRQAQRQTPRTRRGAERTPLPPPNGGYEEEE